MLTLNIRLLFRFELPLHHNSKTMTAYRNYDEYKLANPFDEIDHLEPIAEEETQEDEDY